MQYPDEYDEGEGEGEGGHDAGRGGSGGGAPADAATVFPFGKHKGKTFGDVFQSEAGYVAWVCGQDSLQGLMADFRDHCLAQGYQAAAAPPPSRKREADTRGGGGGRGDGVMAVGKHKGKTFSEVMNTDEGYCQWAASADNPSGNLAEFQEFLRARGIGPSPAKKHAGGGGGGGESQGGRGGGGGADEGGTIPSGKLAGKTFAAALQSDASYCEWVCGLDDIKAPWMHELKQFCLAKGVRPKKK